MRKIIILCLSLCLSAAFSTAAFANEAETTYQASMELPNGEFIGIGYEGGSISEDEFHELAKTMTEYAITPKSRNCPDSNDSYHHYTIFYTDSYVHYNNGIKGSHCIVDVYKTYKCNGCSKLAQQYSSTASHIAGDKDYFDCIK